MLKMLVERIAPRYGFVKVPPRHSGQLMAETPREDLTAYGRSQLPKWQAKRAKVVKLWNLLDEISV